jgi:hypothetical protein
LLKSCPFGETTTATPTYVCNFCTTQASEPTRDEHTPIRAKTKALALFLSCPGFFGEVFECTRNAWAHPLTHRDVTLTGLVWRSAPWSDNRHRPCNGSCVYFAVWNSSWNNNHVNRNDYLPPSSATAAPSRRLTDSSSAASPPFVTTRPFSAATIPTCQSEPGLHDGVRVDARK